MLPSESCYALIKTFEGLELSAYPDPATHSDPWTIGYGHTGPEVHRGLVWTRQQADEALRRDVQAFGARVLGALSGARTTQGQFDALVSFAYNLGIANLKSSTLLKLHKAGRYVEAAAQFVRWNKAAGKEMKGLTRRREAEAAAYRA